MPLIEELPTTQSHRITHGWAYIPDTGLPSIAAIQPGTRKRNRDTAHTSTLTATATARQQKAIQARLDSLDKENYKDVTVPIPSRQGGEKKRDRKMTTNVRRILTYQRGFAHYLADEEANPTAIASVAGAGAGTVTQARTAVGTGRGDARRKASTIATDTVTVSTPTPTPRRGRPPASEKRKAKEKEKMPPPSKPVKQEDTTTDTDMPDAPTSTSQPQPQSQTQPSPPPTTTSTPSSKPLDPLLLTTGLPKMPSARVMAILVSEPPLRYTAARARTEAPGDDGDDVPKPARRFCSVCGYWGQVKCRGCGDWTCGALDCWGTHGGVCAAGPLG